MVNRRHDRKPDAKTHLRQRVASTSSRVLCDLIESCCGFELPETQEGYSRPEAIEKLRQMTHERFERFLRSPRPCFFVVDRC